MVLNKGMYDPYPKLQMLQHHYSHHSHSHKFKIQALDSLPALMTTEHFIFSHLSPPPLICALPPGYWVELGLGFGYKKIKMKPKATQSCGVLKCSFVSHSWTRLGHASAAEKKAKTAALTATKCPFVLQKKGGKRRGFTGVWKGILACWSSGAAFDFIFFFFLQSNLTQKWCKRAFTIALGLFVFITAKAQSQPGLPAIPGMPHQKQEQEDGKKTSRSSGGCRELWSLGWWRQLQLSGAWQASSESYRSGSACQPTRQGADSQKGRDILTAKRAEGKCMGDIGSSLLPYWDLGLERMKPRMVWIWLGAWLTNGCICLMTSMESAGIAVAKWYSRFITNHLVMKIPVLLLVVNWGLPIILAAFTSRLTVSLCFWW